MWIVPKNYIPSSLFLPECVESKEDLKASSQMLEQSVMWRGKHSSLKTWCNRWNRVYWLPHLFGRMLKPSQHTYFEARLQESQAVGLVSLFPWPDKEMELTTQDTFFRIYSNTLKQLDLFTSSEKMSQDTLVWDSQKFMQAYEIWVTQLRQESLQRRKLARHIAGRGSLSSQSETMWSTPTASEPGRTTEGFTPHLKEQVMRTKTSRWATPKVQNAQGAGIHGQGGMDLQTQVMNWPTPTAAMDSMYQCHHPENRNTSGLATQVMNWPTPIGSDCGAKQTINSDQNSLMKAIGQHDQEKNSTPGKNQEPLEKMLLNPAWVAQLQGITLERIFYGCSETEWSPNVQN